MSQHPIVINSTIQMLACRAPTLPPATHSNVFVVGSGEALLVDPASPFPDEIDHLEAWIKGLQHQGLRFKAMVATHHHPDHIGAASELKRRLQLPLWAHPITIEYLKHLEFDLGILPEMRIGLDGPTPTTVQAVHTPGHAKGHLCFLDQASNTLLVGDMVATEGTILVSPIDGNMTEYLLSLERMRELKTDMLLPAHGNPITDPIRKLNQTIAHRLMREGKVLQALQEYGGPAAPHDLLPKAYDDVPKSSWSFAAASTEAHLLKLLSEKRVGRTSNGWISLPTKKRK